ncbi:MAG: LysE family transporter [Deltaproteobacteria bacterium]|nr:LysE family transporter [Deltaproteobacteria bacterium]
MFFKSLLLGFIVAIPIGPIALLILQRSLGLGYLAGFASGIGAAAADALFALFASMGLVALISWLEKYYVWIQPVGGLIVVVLGLKFFFNKPPLLKADEVLTPRYLHHYTWDAFSTFLLTLTNPMTMFAFAALFTGSNLIPVDPRKIFFFEITSGIFCGSLSWWLILVTLSHPIKKNISPLRIRHVMQGLALVLIALGSWAVLSSFPQ